MSKEHKLVAFARNDEGKGASRRLRRAGQLPAVIYGGGEAPQSITLNQEPVWLAQQHDWFYSSLISLDIDGKVERVLLRDMQRHPYKQIIMHLDFQRIPQGVEITVRVPLHFTNIENSPAGKSAEVTVTSELNDVEVVMLPRHLPEFIEVDLGSIKAGDTVHLSDVKLPEGVRLAHAISDEFNPAVAVARYGKGHVEDEAPAAEGEGEGE